MTIHDLTRRAMLPAVLLCGLLPVAAFAAPSTLVLVIAGEAYDGAPRFEVSFDGAALGEGLVDAAIDTATAGRFAEANDKTPYVQIFQFEIPEAQFVADGDIRIRFLNEAYGGDGSNRDRNLYLASASLNGRMVPAMEFVTTSGGGVEPNAMLGEYLVLFDGTADGLVEAPEGGWPLPPADIAEAPAEIELDFPVVAAEEPPLVASRPAPAVEPAETIPAALDMTRTAAITPGEPALEPAETAEVDPDPEAGARCGVNEQFQIVGFNRNSNEVTPRITAQLDAVADKIGDQRCTVTLVGYSSVQGSFATNALFAVERAQNALSYLRDKGLAFATVTATGVGETEQFGPEFHVNRRVIITVTP